MVRQTMRKDMRRLFKRLDDDDRERVLKFAEGLADSTSKSPESLVEGDTRPSYTAVADEDAYERKKERKEHREKVYGQG